MDKTAFINSVNDARKARAEKYGLDLNKLTLDEKINIKFELAKRGVNLGF